MKRTIRKTLHITLGIFLILIGFLGLVLPILNGIIPIILGLILISFESQYIEKKLYSLSQKNSRVHALYLKLEKITKKVMRVDR